MPSVPSADAEPTANDRPATVRPAAGDDPAPRRIGVLGGTFDPPHIGHLVAGAWVHGELALDEVLYVVANRPWQKVDARQVSPAEDRFAMVEAAVRDIDGLEASRIEIDRGGDSYTIDTVEQLRARRPSPDVFVIIGADVTPLLPTWERPHELREAATMVVVDRDGAPPGEPPAGWVLEQVHIPRIDVTSTELRRRVASGRTVDGAVPPCVSALIRDRGLYRGSLV